MDVTIAALYHESLAALADGMALGRQHGGVPYVRNETTHIDESSAQRTRERCMNDAAT